MSELINKKSLERLAELARIELNPQEEEKMLKDLQAILNYFEELKAVPTDNVEPMTGGTNLRSVVRLDETGRTSDTGRGAESFPDTKNGYLKVPPVF